MCIPGLKVFVFAGCCSSGYIMYRSEGFPKPDTTENVTDPKQN